VQSKLKMLRSSTIAGLVADVRGCAEGDIEEAVSTAELFCERNDLILTVRQNGKDEERFVAAGESVLGEFPIVVLVDGGTSGVGEIFAAALLDNEVAELIGQRTNGLGSMQERFQLEDGSVLFVSTHMFYRPTDDPIQGSDIRKSGLKPGLLSPNRDFVTSFYLENTPEDADRDLPPDFYRRLDAAIEVEQFEDGLKELRRKIEEFQEMLREKAA
jgi:carboxyl-terminal processing protease